MKRALISVYDKKGITEFAKGLSDLGYEIISTGQTFNILKDSGVTPLLEIKEITNFPEMLDGRLKTLHPNVHGGILSIRGNDEHMRQISGHGIQPIDIVVNNLYPFKQTILKEGATLEDAVENIDIGGPSMLRAAAKNFKDVTVIVDPHDYPQVLDQLKNSGSVSYQTRFELSAKAFMYTAHYDSMIAAYMREQAGLSPLPELLTLTYERLTDMRYGENPHQNAAFYREVKLYNGDIAGLKQLHGKELSYNNINDAHGALELLKEFDEPAAVACKHAVPCAAATGKTIHEAYNRAYAADPMSIFGGIVALNRQVDEHTALELNKIFLDIVIAPDYTEKAFAILSRKKNLRLLTVPGISEKQPDSAFDFKKVSGGLLVQHVNNALLPESGIKTVTKRAPSEVEMNDLIFAWKVVKHVKSNAIVIAKNNQSVGIGCGQVNRFWPCEQAIEHGIAALGVDAVKGAVLASDAYFPMDDCVRAAAAAGITAIIQPGGSIKDQDSIDACNELGIAMVFTGMRHFRH